MGVVQMKEEIKTVKESNAEADKELLKDFPKTILDLKKALLALKDSFFQDVKELANTKFENIDNIAEFETFMSERFQPNSGIHIQGIIPEAEIIIGLRFYAYPSHEGDNVEASNEQ